ncbi:hypothetical protein FH972_023446 [Carpinus fangiana]|uniref:Conserved oligomeric Golgi complex subunit 8 n=1 Tax=Carpinus fangiana TaxID=176857 RepID=A0A5N6KVQ6_9ROSI|nr:hypothetical protein FH972_023446 [Carpinus fangiana]
MAESLYEVLAPHFDTSAPLPASRDQATSNYLNRLYTLSVDAVTSTEPDSLSHEEQTSLRSLQALSKRSYRTIDSATTSLQHLRTTLPAISSSSDEIKTLVPSLESASSTFAAKYGKPAENPVLDRRRRAMRLGENVDRLADILELPTLLSSTISAAAVSSSASVGATNAASSSTAASANANYASALDLYAHIKRLQRLYPSSELVQSIALQAEAAMRDMTTSLIVALRSNSLKLAGGMRLIGLLRRVAPELDDDAPGGAAAAAPGKPTNISVSTLSAATPNEGSLGALFLVCRLTNLSSMLDALDPLRDLADQETTAKKSAGSKIQENSKAWASGQQTERYLKRYIEIFREQCFAMVSMYKSIFPASLPGPAADGIDAPESDTSAQSQTIPAALSTFTMHLVDELCDTLREYLPNVQEQSARDSLLTQVLYCAGSLGRLGGDFGMMLALLEEDMEEGFGVKEAESPEWIQAMKKHRVQAGRLELLASGAGARREVASPRTQPVAGVHEALANGVSLRLLFWSALGPAVTADHKRRLIPPRPAATPSLTIGPSRRNASAAPPTFHFMPFQSALIPATRPIQQAPLHPSPFQETLTVPSAHKVPGVSPFTHCSCPDTNLLQITALDLDFRAQPSYVTETTDGATEQTTLKHGYQASLRMAGNLTADVLHQGLRTAVHVHRDGQLVAARDDVALEAVQDGQLASPPRDGRVVFERADWFEAALLRSGRYHVRAEGVTRQGRRVFCVEGEVRLRAGGRARGDGRAKVEDLTYCITVHHMKMCCMTVHHLRIYRMTVPHIADPRASAESKACSSQAKQSGFSIRRPLESSGRNMHAGAGWERRGAGQTACMKPDLAEADWQPRGHKPHLRLAGQGWGVAAVTIVPDCDQKLCSEARKQGDASRPGGGCGGGAVGRWISGACTSILCCGDQ